MGGEGHMPTAMHEPEVAASKNSKKKAIIKKVIKDVGEADQALGEIAEAQRRVAELKVDYDRRIAALQKEAADAYQPHLDRIEGLTNILFVFANSNREALVAAGTKMIELSAGVMQWRMTPPAVTFTKGVKIKRIVALLEAANLHRFIRTSKEPDKEAILKEKELVTDKVAGIKISQREEFAVKPVTGLAEIVRTVKALLKRVT